MDLFSELEASLKQAVDIKNGKLDANRTTSVEIVDSKLIRKELKITQKQLSEVLNTSVDTIKSWESGRRNPSGLARKVLLVLSQNGELLDKFQTIQ